MFIGSRSLQEFPVCLRGDVATLDLNECDSFTRPHHNYIAFTIAQVVSDPDAM